jgi:integrase
VAGSILQRCAGDEWKNMIPRAPKIPLFNSSKIEPKWITREQAHQLLGRFPLHTRDMTIFSLATGLRKSNVAGLEWERIDLARRRAFAPLGKKIESSAATHRQQETVGISLQ